MHGADALNPKLSSSTSYVSPARATFSPASWQLFITPARPREKSDTYIPTNINVRARLTMVDRSIYARPRHEDLSCYIYRPAGRSISSHIFVPGALTVREICIWLMNCHRYILLLIWGPFQALFVCFENQRDWRGLDGNFTCRGFNPPQSPWFWDQTNRPSECRRVWFELIGTHARSFCRNTDIYAPDRWKTPQTLATIQICRKPT